MSIKVWSSLVGINILSKSWMKHFGTDGPDRPRHQHFSNPPGLSVVQPEGRVATCPEPNPGAQIVETESAG